ADSARHHSERGAYADHRLRVSPRETGKTPPPAPPRTGGINDEVVIEVTARPGASHRGVIGVTVERLAIGVNSRPEKGKANEELIEYLAREMRVPRSALL